MCKELTELYEKLSPDHRDALMAIAKDMASVEKFNKRLSELTTK